MPDDKNVVKPAQPQTKPVTAPPKEVIKTPPPPAAPPVRPVAVVPAPVLMVGDIVLLEGRVTNVDMAKGVVYVQHSSGQGSSYEFPLRDLKKK